MGTSICNVNINNNLLLTPGSSNRDSPVELSPRCVMLQRQRCGIKSSVYDAVYKYIVSELETWKLSRQHPLKPYCLVYEETALNSC